MLSAIRSENAPTSRSSQQLTYSRDIAARGVVAVLAPYVVRPGVAR